MGAGVLVEDPWLDLHLDSGGENALEQRVRAAVRYRIAVGPIALEPLPMPGGCTLCCLPSMTDRYGGAAVHHQDCVRSDSIQLNAAWPPL